MKINEIKNQLSKHIDIKDILFVTKSGENSSDLDIYCITKKGPSSIHMYYNEENIWTELFIDSIDDVNKKITNIDEIAINFIAEMEFFFGDTQEYNKLLTKAKAKIKKYTPNLVRKNKIIYRIKTLYSKISKKNDKISTFNNKLIINSITYPLIELIFMKESIFPSSPKRWIGQINQKVSKDKKEKILNF